MHYRISLRVTHPARTLQAIVDSLALGEPRIGRSAGDARKSRDGLVLGVNRDTFCTYELTAEQTGTFDAALESVVALLEPRDSALLEIAADGGFIEVYAGVFLDGAESTGFTISPSLSQRLARLNLATTVEIYS